MPWIKEKIEESYGDRIRTTWSNTNDYDRIMEAAPGDLVYVDDKEELILEINSMLGAIPGLTFVQHGNHDTISYYEDDPPLMVDRERYRGDYHSPESKAHAERHAEQSVNLAKQYGGKIKANPYYEYDEDLLKYGGVVDRNHHLRYDPKMARTMIKRRAIKAEEQKERQARYEIHKEVFIYVEDLRDMAGEMLNYFPYDAWIRPYDRTIHAIANYLMMVCDIFNWHYGKGAYRSLDKFKIIKKKWKNSNHDGSRFQARFIEFMNREENAKAPSSKIELKPRSIYYRKKGAKNAK